MELEQIRQISLVGFLEGMGHKIIFILILCDLVFSQSFGIVV